MKRILLIEDDSLIANVYREKLSSEGFEVDVAADGVAGLETFSSRKPDLVLLDLLLPEVNGIDVLKTIRAQFAPRDLPVLVFTNAFLGGSVQQAWEAGANQVLSKTTMTPRLITNIIKNALDDPPPSAASRSTRVQAVGRKARNDPQMREEFLESAPETLETLWKPIKGLITERGNLSHLKELSATMRPLTATAALVGLPAFARMAAACEALFNDLLIKPQHVTPSVLLTIAQALDTLKFLFRHPDSLADKPPSAARILVVDDDVFTRQVVTRALQNVHLTVKCVDNAVSALKRRVGAHFDLILLDIEMPGANGFDLCTQLRAVPAHRQTPIVFLSMHADVAHRVESMLRGGDDFITKPFLFMELAVKALSYVIKGRVKQTGANCDSNGDDAASGFSRRDLDALKHAVLASLDRK
jgi:DNA-binding response OmpR family regulator